MTKTTQVLLVALLLASVSPSRNAKAEEVQPTSPTRWNLGELEAGKTFPTTIAAKNISCKGKHSFEVEIVDTPWLRLDGPSTLEKIRMGKSRDTRAVVDTNGLTPGPYRGRVRVVCVTCPPPPRCRQSLTNIEVLLSVAGGASDQFMPGVVERTPVDAFDGQVRELAEAIASFANDNLNMPGLSSIREVASNAYSGRTEAERVLIAGRLYQGLLTGLRDRTRDAASYGERAGSVVPSAARIREALSEPLPVAVASRNAFDEMLGKIRARVAEEPEYGLLLRNYRNRWGRVGGIGGRFRCVVDGMEVSPFVCNVVLTVGVVDRIEISGWDYAFRP